MKVFTPEKEKKKGNRLVQQAVQQKRENLAQDGKHRVASKVFLNRGPRPMLN
jgi:hypothetical protein